MKIKYSLFVLLLSFIHASSAQEIKMTETGALEQIYGEAYESEGLLPFNDLDLEFGYVLYQAEVDVDSNDLILELENTRDYAVAYLNEKFQGTVTDSSKRLLLNATPGTYNLTLYAENIGRITYGPEILDNFKGLFGSITLDGEEVEGWRMIPLNVRSYDVDTIVFTELLTDEKPHFSRGHFDINDPTDTYVDISGWGMGEVWINGNYVGSYWEEESQQSIHISSDNLFEGRNEIIIFELKNNNQSSVKLSSTPVFK